MSVVPKNLAERIAWYQARQTAWTTNAVAVGLSAGEMTTMSGYITSAVTALTDQVNARNLAKAKTVTLHDTEGVMARYGSDLVAKIRAKAGQVGGDSVYALALIPPPATPTPVGAPGTPYQLTVALKPSGAVELKWKCDNPVGAQGTFYQIGRKAAGAAEFAYLGGTGERKFVDATLPAGSASVVYSIQAMRSTAMGDEAEFIVNFGVSSGGIATATVTDLTPVRRAA
jgi:hypothetical protein